MRVTIEHGINGAMEASRRGDAIAVIDVLRASTSYSAMLISGAERIIPYPSKEKLEEAAKGFPGAIKSGERECKKIKGFDIGSSPSSIINLELKGKIVLSSTTNGSKVANASRGSSLLIMSGFCNISKSCKMLLDSGMDISLVCCGRKGLPVPEDSICAAEMSSALLGNDAHYLSHDELINTCKKSKSYKTLINADLEEDFEICLKRDIFDAIPIFDGVGFRSYSNEIDGARS